MASRSPGANTPPTGGEPPASGRRISLLWWVFLTNGAVLIVAFLLLSVTPITISAPIALEQLALLLAGLAVMLALNLVLLRRVLAPLFTLTHVMSAVDPDQPGRTLAGARPYTTEGVTLVAAFNAMLERLESARREATRVALAAQEGEKLRIGRELHDELGQELTAALLQAERAADGNPELAQAELMRVAEAIRQSLDEVRRIARELRPEALDDLGLVNALIALCSRVDAQGLRVKRQLQGKLPEISSDVELVIYRIAQESLTNALRHARARTATVSLEADNKCITLSVADDGDGMPDGLPGDTAGISGMRERALLIGGRLAIESRAGEGTRVQLTVPSGRGQPSRRIVR